mgnify:CR=1
MRLFYGLIIPGGYIGGGGTGGRAGVQFELPFHQRVSHGRTDVGGRGPEGGGAHSFPSFE